LNKTQNFIEKKKTFLDSEKRDNVKRTKIPERNIKTEDSENLLYTNENINRYILLIEKNNLDK